MGTLRWLIHAHTNWKALNTSWHVPVLSVLKRMTQTAACLWWLCTHTYTHQCCYTPLCCLTLPSRVSERWCLGNSRTQHPAKCSSECHDSLTCCWLECGEAGWAVWWWLAWVWLTKHLNLMRENSLTCYLIEGNTFAAVQDWQPSSFMLVSLILDL